MGILVRHDEEELGPFGRDEIFARLRAGEFKETDPARTEESEEWKPLKEILQQNSAMALFSVEKIVAQEAELPAPKLTFEPPPRPEKAEEKKTESDPTGWGWRESAILAAMAMAVAFFVAFVVVRQEPSAPAVASPTIASNAPAPARSAAIKPPAPAEPQPPRLASNAPPAPVVPPVAPEPRPVRPPDPAPLAEPQPVNPPPNPGSAEPSRAVALNTVPAMPPPASVLPATPAPQAAATPGPAKLPPVVVRDVKLPEVKEIKSSSFWTAATAADPKGVLLLCTGGDERPEGLVKNKEWQKFAQDHGLGLAAVSFAVDEKILKASGGSLQASKGAGAALLTGLDKTFGAQVPLIVFGRSGGGTFGTSFVHWKPGRVSLWAAYSPKWTEVPKKDKLPGPALIVCDHESAVKSDEARNFFTQGRTLNKPWTWVCLNTPWKERGAQLDRFFKDYAHAILQSGGDLPAAVWADMDSKRLMSALDRMTKGANASWLPADMFVEPWSALMPASQPTGQATIVQRSVPTRNPKQPTVELFLRLPRTDGKKPISGVLAFCTWENNQASILSKLDIQADDKQVDLPGPAAMVRSIIRYAENHNMAVLTWGTVEAWNNQVNTEELDKEKQKEFDRNFDLLANAWERGVNELSQETGIPTNNMLLYGMSRGAQWAHRLALRKPEHFLAVHVHIPSTFDKPTPQGNKPLWLVTTGELEYGYERSKLFYNECQALGYPMIFKAIVGIGHAGSPIADSLGTKFFDYALSVKAQREAYDEQRKDALNRFAKQSAGPWLKTFREPEFLGDIVNQELFPVAQADMIPKPFRVALPTKVLADAWNH